MIVGSLGEFVFQSGKIDGGVTFNNITYTRSSRIVSHATIEGAPIVEVLGLDSSNVTISGVLNAEFSGDLDNVMNKILSLQDGKPRALTRGTHCYGLFYIDSIDFSEDSYNGDKLQSISYSIKLVSTRE